MIKHLFYIIKKFIYRQPVIKSGYSFTATFNDGIHKGNEVFGKIQIEDGKIYLCQNTVMGASCRNRLGYEHSWFVGKLEDFEKILYKIDKSEIIDLKIFKDRKSRIQNLK